MPYKSKAQQKLFHYLESKGEMPKKVVKKYDNMTEFEDLPEHVKEYMGGIMGDVAEQNLYETLDTSGEPGKSGEEEGYGFSAKEKHFAKGGMVEGEGKEIEPKKDLFAKHLAKKMLGY